MNVRELTFRGEDTPQLYACDVCGSSFSPKIYACADDLAHATARQAAEECCAPRHCACGVEIEKYYTACATCRERNRLKAATIVTDYTGPVQSDQVEGSEWGEGYSSSVDALRNYCDDPAPAYCWPCKASPLRLDLDSILESALDDQHEDAAEQIVGDDELGAAIDKFNAAQTCITYYPDHTRVIVLDQARFDAILHPAPAGAGKGGDA
ncbi:hypothetical protein D2T29_12620 [Sinirhodobacter populi]|uniref:Uncharacterized protein n=1 Tax=Paenirhodobacter populi TaxID=2306993 RepID=A0A443KCJ3_9RHOB|nr:hypothetical protein [Sinirhodobacter populi]RWR30508.1 hypothetical protein D2T29_12620 [Sinirhodobacter populi]